MKPGAVNPHTKPFRVRQYIMYSDDPLYFNYSATVDWDIIKYEGIKYNEYLMLASANPVGTENGGSPMHIFLLRSRDGIYCRYLLHRYSHRKWGFAYTKVLIPKFKQVYSSNVIK